MKASFFLITIFLKNIYSSEVIEEVTDEVNLYMKGGQEAQDGQFQYQAALRWKNGDIYSNGAILNSRWILTCRKCIPDPAINEVEVVVGSVNPRKGVAYDVEKVTKYPGDKDTTDIGLIKVDREIEFNWKTKPAKIDSNYIDGDVAVVLSAW